jgi:BASS family bile acid:Na+ symporter
MEIVTKIAPICLALIMLGLGLGLSIKDFVRILRVPKDFFVGFFSQLVILPIVALGVALILDLPYTNCHRLDDNCSSTRRRYFKCIN